MHRRPDVSWDRMRASWMRPQRNGKPTPWDALIGSPSSRTAGNSDLSGAVRIQGCQLPDAPSGTRRVWVDADRYFYELDKGVSTPPFEARGALVWQYQGQAVFDRCPSAAEGVWRESALEQGGYDRVPAVDQVLVPGRAARVDAMGRRWVLASVDADTLGGLLRAADARESEAGTEPDWFPFGTPRAFVPFLREEVAPAFSRPTWFTYDELYCSGVWKVANWHADFLDRMTWPLSSWGQSVVLVTTSGGVLSGTYLGTGSSGTAYVLTAAHGVVNYKTDGTDMDASAMSVSVFTSTMGSASSVVGVADFIHGSYLTVLDTAEDWVVLTLASAPGVSIDAMSLSQRTTSLTSWTARTRAYPGGDPDGDGCDSNSGPDQYGAQGDIAGVNYSATNFFLSTAAGMSGGPFYYCWTGDCSEGVRQTSLHALYTGLSINGPRSTDIRSSVIAAMV